MIVLLSFYLDAYRKKEKEAKLFEFLTPDQQNKYRELVEQKKKEMEKSAKDKY